MNVNKRSLGLAGLVVSGVLALPASAATPAFKTGVYRGTGAGVQVRLTASKSAITSSSLVAKDTCTPTDVNIREIKGGAITPIAIHKDSFSSTVAIQNGAVSSTIAGRLSGSSASGTFSITGHYTLTGQPLPAAPFTCTTGTVHWTAKLG